MTDFTKNCLAFLMNMLMLIREPASIYYFIWLLWGRKAEQKGWVGALDLWCTGNWRLKHWGWFWLVICPWRKWDHSLTLCKDAYFTKIVHPTLAQVWVSNGCVACMPYFLPRVACLCWCGWGLYWRGESCPSISPPPPAFMIRELEPPPSQPPPAFLNEMR